MYVRRRIGKRRTFFKKHRVLLLLLLSMGAVCLLAFIGLNGIRNALDRRMIAQSLPRSLPQMFQEYSPVRYERTVYPYSVIPGGVRSREELAATTRSDPVVAAHFADFNLKTARMVRAQEARLMYVSYRLRDTVYWTAKPVRIPEGETLITDGDCEARARCGNRVSAVPQEPVAEEEPAIETFDIPELARLDQPALDPMPVTGLDFGPVPEAPSLGPFASSPTPAILPYYYRPLFLLSPPLDIPEPGTLGLLIAGLAGVFAIRRFRKK